MRAKLPKEWQLAPLGSLATDLLSGGTPSTKRADYWNGTIPWITSKWLGDPLRMSSGEKYISLSGLADSASNVVPAGSLIYATRVGVGKVAVNEIDIAINQDLVGILIDPRKALPEFLAYQLRTNRVKSFVDQNKRGATIQGITKTCVREIEIALPPLHEQRQIAAVLSAVQQAIERQDCLIALTSELKKALMHKLFTEGTRGEPLKQTEIGPVPESWTVTTLGQLCRGPNGGIYTGPFGSSLHKSEYQDVGTPIVNPVHLIANHIDDANVPRIGPAAATRLERYRLRDKDILFGRRGDIGRHGIVTKAEAGWFCGTGCFIVRVSDPRIDADYLSAFVSKDEAIGWLVAHAAGVIMPNLSNKVLDRMPVGFPSREEQAVITAVLRSVDGKLSAHTLAASALKSLFRTLLHQLMTANIRVHDLDFSALLEEVEPASAGSADTGP